jgi:hypothetical protein
MKARINATNIRVTRADGGATVSFDLEIGKSDVTVEYMNGAGPDSPHDTDGTLGDHEARHVASLKQWWTTDNVQGVAQQNRMATTLAITGDTSNAAVRAAVRAQLVDIEWSLSRLSNAFEATMVDNHQYALTVPFYGARAYTARVGP